MYSASIKEFSKNCWTEIYNRVIGAVVFIDDASAECLHWDGGLLNLLSVGAVCVKSLSPFEYVNRDHKKALFISEATPTQLYTICDIIRNSDLTHCKLICTVSLDVVYLELNEGEDVTDVIASGRAHVEATRQLEGMLLEWIGKEQSAVEVVHVPIFSISPTSSVFLTPPHSHIYPSHGGSLSIDTTTDLHALSSDTRSHIRRLASSLNSLMHSMNLKEDVYHMGNYSALLAGVLENSPVCVSRRKSCTHPASLIIVDRTLDLCSVTSHNTDSVLDKIMSVLPRFPGHTTDVAVDMSLLCEANVIKPTEDVELSPGCLYHNGDDACVQTFEHMINKSQKEVMFDLYNKLSKIDLQRSPGLKTLTKITTQSVEKILVASKGNYDVIENNLGVMQQALAVVQTLKSPVHAHIEFMMNLEKQVLQNVATSRESTSVLLQMSNFIKSRKERNQPLDRFLALLVNIYSLTGTQILFNKQHEDELTKTLAVAIFEDHKLLFDSDYERAVTPEESESIAEKMMDRLKEIARMRQRLNNFNSVLRRREAGGGEEYCGVLQQLVEALVDPARPDTDLLSRTDTLNHLFRTSLSILTSKKKPTAKHPLDNPVVVIFVVGGVTSEECKSIHRTVITSGIDTTVLVGSTKFVNPVEAMKDALMI